MAEGKITVDYSVVPRDQKLGLSNAVVNPNGQQTTVALTLAAPAPQQPPWYDNAAVVVPIVTVFGIVATIFAAERRSRSEIKHANAQANRNRRSARAIAELQRDAAKEEQHRDRITQARREAYVEASSGLQDVLNGLQKLAYTPYDEVEMGRKLDVFHASINRIELLGGMDAVLAAKEVAKFVALLHIEACKMLLPINNISQDQRQSSAELAVLENEVRYVAREVEAGRAEWPSSGSKYGLELEAKFKQISDLKAKAAQSSTQRDRLRADYRIHILKSIKAVSTLVSPLAAHARAEMGLETDAEAVQRSTESSELEVMMAVNELFELNESLTQPREHGDLSKEK